MHDPGLRSWSAVAQDAAARLRAGGFDNALAEARWIVEEASGVPVAELVAATDEPATDTAVRRVDAMVERRCAGEPLQYVLGRWGFRSLDLAVDARVLIPRPETEQVVEAALVELDRCRAAAAATRAPARLIAVDLGTGSGAIGLAIAAERPHVEVWATDRCTDALDVARANLAGIGRGATRVQLATGDWFDALPVDLVGRVDVVISNPPYVPDAAVLDDGVADWEPVHALRSGSDGLDDLRRIAAEAPTWLAPGGALVVECGSEQIDEVIALCAGSGMAPCFAVTDMAGRGCGVVARCPATGQPVVADSEAAAR